MGFNIGDWVSFIYTQPGNEVTYCIISELKGDKAKLYDPLFDLFVDVKMSRLSKLTEEHLCLTIKHCDYGRMTIRELLKKGEDFLAGKTLILRDRKRR